MTGYTVNTGSTTKFSENWDRIFAGKSKKGGTSGAKAKSSQKLATSKKTPRK